jgi:hypothetical protein
MGKDNQEVQEDGSPPDWGLGGTAPKHLPTPPPEAATLK